MTWLITKFRITKAVEGSFPTLSTWRNIRFHNVNVITAKRLPTSNNYIKLEAFVLSLLFLEIVFFFRPESIEICLIRIFLPIAFLFNIFSELYAPSLATLYPSVVSIMMSLQKETLVTCFDAIRLCLSITKLKR